MQLLDQVRSLDFPAALPDSLLVVEQRFDAPAVADVAQAVRQALDASDFGGRIQPGDSVAVGVGSRGIANLPEIVHEVIAYLRRIGAEPFVIPAMGSHGGATAEGQKTMLAELGVTESSVGAEIRATMEVKKIGQIFAGPSLFQDVISAAADHTLLINRIKPHTDFHGDLESGLAKMCVIGLGKQRGAVAMHAYGAAGFQNFLAPAARIYQSATNVIGGLAILENAHDQTAHIVGLDISEIGAQREIDLMEQARKLMASLPFPEIDVLVIRDIGKNISGTGMDTNIIGRLMIPRQPEPANGPDVAVIAVLDLTKETHGNAAGIGMANVTTVRVAEKIDWVATYTNAITSGIFGMQRVSLPITMADDRRALQAAVLGCGRPQQEARLVFIENTLALSKLWTSPNLRSSIEGHPRLQATGRVPLAFDAYGAMTSPWKIARSDLKNEPSRGATGGPSGRLTDGA